MQPPLCIQTKKYKYFSRKAKVVGKMGKLSEVGMTSVCFYEEIRRATYYNNREAEGGFELESKRRGESNAVDGTMCMYSVHSSCGVPIVLLSCLFFVL